MKILLYPWFHPALWPSTLTRARQGENNRNMTCSLWAEAWTWTAEVKYTLRNVAFTLRLESPKETVQRLHRMGSWGGVSTGSVLKGKLNIHCFLWVQKIIISHEVCSYIPQCNRDLVPTCILTLSSMVRIRQFVEYAVRHRLYSLSHSHSLSQRQEGLCRVSV